MGNYPRIFWISASLGVIILILLMVYQSEKPDMTLSILLTFVSIGAGVLVSQHYGQKSFDSKEKEKIEYYAKAAYRLSKAMDRIIRLFIKFSNLRLTNLESKTKISITELEQVTRDYQEKLLVLKSLILSANENWKEMLPPKDIAEFQKKIIETEEIASNLSIAIEEFKIGEKYGTATGKD